MSARLSVGRGVLPALLVLLLAASARADELKIRPPGPPAPPSGATWLGRFVAVVRLPGVILRRDVARHALAAIGTQSRPDPLPYQQVIALAQACLDAAPPPTEADVDHVGKARGLSITQVLDECRILRAQAASEVERASAQAAQRALDIRPLLRGDRLKVFDAEGEPECGKCAAGADAATVGKELARAAEWKYVRGPSGPLATFDTMIFVFRGDKLVERRQRRAHEQP